MSVGVRVALVPLVVLLLAATVTGSARPAAAPGEDNVDEPAVGAFRSSRTYAAVPVPVRLRIPPAGVDTPLEALRRNDDATIAVPADPDVAGWYENGPRPGQPGPAVILGHVDSTAGPAVFFHLAALPVGAAIYVDGADGTTATFRVTSLTRVPKTEFPTELVYLPTLQPSLRLVTCGGSFDRVSRSYRDNVIVYADPA